MSDLAETAAQNKPAPVRRLIGATIVAVGLLPAAAAVASGPPTGGAVARGGSPSSTVASALRACAPVSVHHRTASRIRTNIGCRRARRLLRRWLRRGTLPHDQFGWYCAGRRNITCGGGNGGNGPYIRFRYRR